MNKNFLTVSLAVIIVICAAGLYSMNKKIEAANATISLLQAQLNANEANNQTAVVAQDQKPNPIPKTISIGDADNGKTLSLVTGEKLFVKITEVGSDGGYQFQNPEYDTSVLHLDNHSLVQPSVAEGVVGASPSGVWNFTALKQGVTDLTIVTARAWDKTDHPFQYKVSVSVQ